MLEFHSESGGVFFFLVYTYLETMAMGIPGLSICTGMVGIVEACR